MDTLTPNAPKSRVEYVIKTYAGTANEVIVPDVIRIAMMTFGMDAQVDDWVYNVVRPTVALAQGRPEVFINRWRTWKVDHPPLFEFYREYVTKAFEKIDIEGLSKAVFNEEYGRLKWPDAHPLDFIVPWAARELGRLTKVVRRGNASWDDYEMAVLRLKEKSTAIAMWSKENSVDLTKTSLAEALDAVKGFEVEIDVEQGEIVYEFEDGYTLQRLRTAGQLSDEGTVMQHCVGEYADAVVDGEVEIYSLRDPNGNPHATMEWDPCGEEFEQIQGKQNATPVAKYLPYLQEVITEDFGGDITGLLLSGMSAKESLELYFTKHSALHRINFASIAITLKGQRGSTFSQFDLNGFDFSGKQLENVTFMGTSLRGAVFEGATVEGTVFATSDMTGCDFRGADIRRSMFRRANLEDSDFGGALIFDCNFQNATLLSADFSSAKISNSLFRQVDIVGANMTDVAIDESSYGSMSAHAAYVVGDVDWSGATLDGVSMRERYGRDDEGVAT